MRFATIRELFFLLALRYDSCYRNLLLFFYVPNIFRFGYFQWLLLNQPILKSPLELIHTNATPPLLPCFRTSQQSRRFYSILTVYLRRFPLNHRIRSALIVFYTSTNRFSKAASFANSLTSIEITASRHCTAELSFAKAYYHYKTDNCYKSLLILRRLHSRYPTRCHFSYLLVTVLISLLMFEEAIYVLQNSRFTQLYRYYNHKVSAQIYLHLGLLLKAQRELFSFYKFSRLKLVILPPIAEHYLSIGDKHSALYIYKLLHACAPPDLSTAINLSRLYMQLYSDLDQSRLYCDIAFRLNPQSPEVLNIKALLHQRDRDYERAIYYFTQIIHISPSFAPAYANLSILYTEQRCLQLADSYIDQALALDPKNSDYLNSKGLILSLSSSTIGQCESYFRQALIFTPTHLEARSNLSMALRSRGNYRLGWSFYSTRNDLSIRKTSLALFHATLDPTREWKGDQNLLPSTKLHVVGEQGVGDLVQFARYIQLLREMRLLVTLVTHSNLHTLISNSTLQVKCLDPSSDDITDYDFWVPLLNLPRIFNASPSTPLLTKPYLRQSPAFQLAWSNLALTIDKPVIGIHWQGNPVAESTNLHGRSFPLESFAPLTRLDVLFLSLQKGPGASQKDSVTFKSNFVPYQHIVDSVWDFQETLSIIDTCLLIITNDSGLAHISASIGKPTWLLLHTTPDWRWGLYGTKSGWYDSIRIYRQHNDGDWSSVMTNVVADLASHLQGLPHA